MGTFYFSEEILVRYGFTRVLDGREREKCSVCCFSKATPGICHTVPCSVSPWKLPASYDSIDILISDVKLAEGVHS